MIGRPAGRDLHRRSLLRAGGAVVAAGLLPVMPVARAAVTGFDGARHLLARTGFGSPGLGSMGGRQFRQPPPCMRQHWAAPQPTGAGAAVWACIGAKRLSCFSIRVEEQAGQAGDSAPRTSNSES